MTGHGQIEQQDVGLQLPGELHGFGPVAGFPDHGELRLGLEQAAQAVAENGMVVGNQNTNGL